MNKQESNSGAIHEIDRREMLKRGAFVVGATALWSTPLVQTLGMQPAGATVGSPTADFCPTPNDGPVLWMVFEYLGADAAEIVVERYSGNSPVKDRGYYCDVETGHLLLVDTTYFSQLNPNIRFLIGGMDSGDLHTSCSQPLNFGDVFGSFKLVAGEDNSGNVLGSPDDGRPMQQGPCTVAQSSAEDSAPSETRENLSGESTVSETGEEPGLSAESRESLDDELVEPNLSSDELTDSPTATD